MIHIYMENLRPCPSPSPSHLGLFSILGPRESFGSFGHFGLKVFQVTIVGDTRSAVQPTGEERIYKRGYTYTHSIIYRLAHFYACFSPLYHFDSNYPHLQWYGSSHVHMLLTNVGIILLFAYISFSM